MNASPLENLHKEFTQALEPHTYLGPDQKDSAKLAHTSKKTIRLDEVFKLATQQIEESLKKKNTPSKDIDQLSLLLEDGKAMHERYTKATNRWSRWFLKGLARLTPALFKSFLPACFSNEMEKAEQNTKEEYDKYRAFVREKITKLSKPDVQEDKEDKKVKDEEPVKKEENLFDPQQDEVGEDKNKKSTDTKKSETKKPEPKKPEPKKPVDPETEKRLKEVREKRIKALEKRDDEDVELQKALAQVYASENPSNQGKDNPKSDNPKSNPSKSDEVVNKDDLDPAEYLDDEEIFDEEEQPDSKPSKPVSPAKPNNPVTPATPVVAPSKEDAEKVRKGNIEDSLDIIRNGLKCINQFDLRPLSLQKYRNVLKRMVNATDVIMKLDPKAQSSLEKEGVKDKIFEVLKDPNFKLALYSEPDQKIADLLQSTPWHASFNEAKAQNGHIKFGLGKVVGQLILKLADANGKPAKEKDFHNYKGSVHLGLVNTTLLSDLEELVKVLDKHSSCCPCSLVIQVQNDSPLTPEFFQLLLKLKDRVAEVRVEGVQEVNFKTLAVSGADEYLFIQHLETFQFPDLRKMILSDHSKKDWTARDFSRLLTFCPTRELLKESYRLCAAYQNIVIPFWLTYKEIDLKGFALDQIPYFLSQCTDLTQADLSGLPMTDAQLFQWIKQGPLAKVQTLQLKDCQNLTTDSLPALATLPQLARVSLPDLPRGKLPLNQLPKFDNPFKIKMFYTTSKATQSRASDLYTGPYLWAPIFQIPLARKGVAEVFAFNQRRLDPKSVAYWLHNSDYQHLKPQKSILTILADSNAGLSDDNLVEFVQKFPETVALSLYNCPQVSDAGIIKLLKACPKIKTLDLMGCSHITESLFFGEGDQEILKKLHKLIITDTGIPSEIAAIFKEPTQMDSKIVFEEATLTISDADLTDDDALEKILKAKKDLTKLKRINLEGCTKLNNKMLGQLLDHLNAPTKLQTKDTLVDNPQRLNLAVLNLKGCKNITDEAFDQSKQTEIVGDDNVPLDQIAKPKIEPKLLENLDRIVIGGTKISEILKQVYPKVTFQEFEEPLTIQIDEEAQLKDCSAYHEMKARDALDDEEQKELKNLTSHYLHNRIVVDLFCEDEDSAQEILSKTIKPNAEEFCDLTLTFKETDDSDPSLIHAHRDALYSQSLYFVDRLRPGGEMSKIGGVDFTNIHATPEVVQIIQNLLYDDKSCIENLDWEIAWHVAELIGPNNFKLASTLYKTLLNRIRSQFSIDKAEEMLEAAEALGDEEGKKEYDETLLAYLDSVGEADEETFQTIANLGKGYGLKKINEKVKRVESKKTNEIIRQEMADQEKENDKLVRDLTKAHKLTGYV